MTRLDGRGRALRSRTRSGPGQGAPESTVLTSPATLPPRVRRGVGEMEAVQSVLPEESALVLGALTQLGDVWFLVVLVTVAYWLGPTPRDRDARAVVVGLALAAFGVILAAKAAFALPRPPQPLADPAALPAVVRPFSDATATASGYGFPSGHAIGATVVYLGLAATLSASTPRRRYAAVAGLIGLVCLTRVALGLHYLVDVVAGVVLGAGLLAATALVGRAPSVVPFTRDPATRTFAGSVVVAAVAGWLTGPSVDALALVGATLGALAGWQVVALARADGTPGRLERVRVVLGVLSAGLVVAAAGVGVLGGHSPLPALGTASVAFGAVAVPAIGALDVDRRRPGAEPRGRPED